ncbi:hypothetical protein EE612_054764 [Oryza sativa]|nr:hypothetical protein EE612_054764 [Oryza sativa]
MASATPAGRIRWSYTPSPSPSAPNLLPWQNWWQRWCRWLPRADPMEAMAVVFLTSGSSGPLPPLRPPLPPSFSLGGGSGIEAPTGASGIGDSGGISNRRI